jgi:carbon starvation protein CstA
MISFFSSIALLLIGYFLYSKVIEKIFGVDKDRKHRHIRSKTVLILCHYLGAKIFLIQFLNIAGLGLFFGAIAGAMWGPVVFSGLCWEYFRRSCSRFLLGYDFG